MSNSTISSPTTDEKPINTKPLSDAAQKVVAQAAKLEESVKQQVTDKANAEIERSAGKLINSIVEKAKNTADKDALMEQIAKSAASKGFGAFNKENWTAAKQLGDIMVCELIAKEIEKNQLLKNGKISADALINLYLGKTFGDQTFMGEVGSEIGKSLDDYINTTYSNAMHNANKNLTTAVDDVIQKTVAEATQVFQKTDKIFNKITSINDINKAIEDAIKDSITLDHINTKLSGTWLGRAIKPGLNKLFDKGISHILKRMTDTGVIDRVTKLQEEIIKQQEYINKARQIIFEHEKIIRTYIDEAKRQAEAMVTQYANQVIADISSKIGVDLGSITGGLF